MDHIEGAIPTPEKQGPVIELPANQPVLRRQLELKLEEYRERLAREKVDMESSTSEPYRAPEVEGSAEFYVFKYRIEILERLLRDGRVDTRELAEKLTADERARGFMFHTLAYGNACRVIDGYVRGLPHHGGTGLPKIPNLN